MPPHTTIRLFELINYSRKNEDVEEEYTHWVVQFNLISCTDSSSSSGDLIMMLKVKV